MPSEALIVCEPATRLGIVLVAPVKVPLASEVAFTKNIPSTAIWTVDNALKFVPFTVTEVPDGPLVGDRTMAGVGIVYVALATLPK